MALRRISFNKPALGLNAGSRLQSTLMRTFNLRAVETPALKLGSSSETSETIKLAQELSEKRISSIVQNLWSASFSTDSAAAVSTETGNPMNFANNATSNTSATGCKYENLVQVRIKEMIMHKDDASDRDRKIISTEELKKRFDCFKEVFNEAESCVKDLRETLFEAEDKQYKEECKCAEGALENAFSAYIDLLEDLRYRSAAEETLDAFNEIRNENALNLKRLRKELDSLNVFVENRKLAAR